MAGGPEIKSTVTIGGLDQVKKNFDDMAQHYQRRVDAMKRAGNTVGAGLQKSVAATGTAIKTTSSVGVRSFQLMASAAGTFVSILRGSLNIILSVGKAAVSLAGKIALAGAASFGLTQAWVIATSKNIEEIGKLARMAGVSTEAFSKMATAVRLAGGESADLTMGLQTLSDKIIDAAKNADGGAATAFAQIGVSVRKANGDIKTTEEVLADVADGLARVPTDTLKASAALDLFGSSGTKLLPILKDGRAGLNAYMNEADKLGTTVTEAQANATGKLLTQYRKVGEAIRGVSYRMVEEILPFMTRNSQKIADYLAQNSAKIGKWTAGVVKELAEIMDDFRLAVTGNSQAIRNDWVRALLPVVKFVKNAFLDLVSMFTGGKATRLPWLETIRDSLLNAGRAAIAFGKAILAGTGIAGKELPTIETMAKNLEQAIRSLILGLSGGNSKDAEMPWAAKAGETLRSFGIIIGAVAVTLNEHKDAIMTAVAFVGKSIENVVVAVTNLMNGKEIPEGNPFTFLSDIAAFVKENSDFIISSFESVAQAFIGAARWIIESLGWVWTGLDALAKMLGLDGVLQLGLVLLILKITGVGAILQKLGTALSTTLFIVNGLIGLFRSLIGIVTSLLIPAFTSLVALLSAAGFGFFAITGIIGVIVAAIGGLVYMIWNFRDEYIDVFWTIVDVGKWWAKTLWAILKLPFDAVQMGIKAAYNSIQWIGQKLGLINEDVAETTEDVNARIAASSDDVTAKLEANQERQTDAVTSAAAEGEKAYDGFFTTVKAKGNATFTGLEDKVAASTGAMTDGTEEAKKAMTSMLDQASAKVSSVSRDMKEEFGSVAPTIQSESLKVGEVVNLQLESVAGGINASTEKLADQELAIRATLQEGMKGAAEMAPFAVDSITSGLDQIPGAVGAIADKTQAASKPMFASIGDQAKDANAAVIDAWKAAPDAFETTGKNIAGGLQSGFETTASSMSKGMNGLVEEQQRFQDTALTKLDQTWKAFGTSFDETTARAKGAFDSLWAGLVDGTATAFQQVTSLWDNLDEFFESLADDIKDVFTDMWVSIQREAAEQVTSLGGKIVSAVAGFAVNQMKSAILPGYANGGILKGPGTGTSDSILARLSNGEGILKAAAVRHYGADFVHALNNMLVPLPGFATGGIADKQGGMSSAGFALALGIDGRRVGGSITADDAAIRSLRRDFRNRASASRGPIPRWRGGV